jgi:putative chitinase
MVAFWLVGMKSIPVAYVSIKGQQGVAEDSEQKNTNDLNEKWSQKYKRSIDCSHPKGFSQRAHCQGRKKNEDTLSEKKRRKAKAKRVYGGYAFYPISAVDSGEGGDGGGLEEGWKEKLAAAGAAGAMALGGYNYVKQPTQTTQQPQPTVQPQQKTIKPITQKPLEKILYNYAVKAGLSGDELAQFMAQCAHETNDWNSLVEYGGSLDFRKYDPKFAPKKAKILGNTKIGDGAKYKGRGYIQITGRYNYTKASKALGIDLVNKPELAQHPDTAAEIALLFWKNRVRPNVDDFQNTTQVTRKINPGLRGLEDRHENYQDYLRGTGNDNK